MIKVLISIANMATALLLFSGTASAEEIYLQGIDYGQGITGTIHVRALNKSGPNCKNAVLAVHGLANTSNGWTPFSDAFFANKKASRGICWFLAIDLAGRGGSSFPLGIQFGNLVLEHHVQALASSIQALLATGRFEIKSLLGHSQGSLILQMLQQSLLNQQSSLATAYGIERVVLLAPAVPAPLPWQIADDGSALQLMQNFVVANNPFLGSYLLVPFDAWPSLFFTTQLGNPATLVTNAPTPAIVASNGYSNIEPLYASLELLGALTGSRPVVSSGIFSEITGTSAKVVAFSHDALVSPLEAESVALHLTGANSSKELINVVSDDAIHSMYISNPTVVAEALE